MQGFRAFDGISLQSGLPPVLIHGIQVAMISALPDFRKRYALFLMWLPLALMWMLMAIEQPAIAAVLARMNDAKLQLAAFGVAFSLALFIEGPIIQMLAAGTALGGSRENYKRLLELMNFLGWTATAVHGLLCFPAIFNPFAEQILGLPKQLILPTRHVMVSMLPWTLSVGYRRLWQGVLIRHGNTIVIPVTMAIRIGVSCATLAWGYSTKAVPAATLGGLSLSNGVIAAAITTYFFTRPVLRLMSEKNTAHQGNSPPSDPRSTVPGDSVSEESSAAAPPQPIRRRDMALFYLPLALTNFITLGARPLMQMGLARGVLPLESLAIWPVSMGYLFLFTSLSLSAQEIVIARLDSPTARKALVVFIRNLALVLSLVYVVVLVTPLRGYWFTVVSGLKPNLTVLIPLTLLFSFPVVPLSTFISLFRGALVSSRRTGEVSVGVLVNVLVLLVSLFAGISFLKIPAVTTVAAAYSLAFSAEFVFLLSRRPLAPFASSPESRYTVSHGKP